MKQLLILSGKGGTGKTTVAGAFIRIAKARAYADCDVDAPNLHLIAGFSTEPKRSDYYGLPKAEIDPDKCAGCGLCLKNCRFDAISFANGLCRIDPFACEGCGVCEAVCPESAVSLKPAKAGELMLFDGNGRVFSTARLRMGSGTSGMLVSEVKKRMKSGADPDTELAVIDGSPGIGCPVIASMSGADMVLIVAEPSISGISDLTRIVKTAEAFGTRTAVCINKYDVNPDNTGRIEAFCRAKELPFVGKIPFDPEAVRAVNSGLTIADVDSPAGRAVGEVFAGVMRLLFEGNGGKNKP